MQRNPASCPAGSYQVRFIGGAIVSSPGDAAFRFPPEFPCRESVAQWHDGSVVRRCDATAGLHSGAQETVFFLEWARACGRGADCYWLRLRHSWRCRAVGCNSRRVSVAWAADRKPSEYQRVVARARSGRLIAHRAGPRGDEASGILRGASFACNRHKLSATSFTLTPAKPVRQSQFGETLRS